MQPGTAFQAPKYAVVMQGIKKNGETGAYWVCVSNGKVIWTRPGILMDYQLGWFDKASSISVLSSDYNVLIVNKLGKIALTVPKFSANKDPAACLFGSGFLSLDLGDFHFSFHNYFKARDMYNAMNSSLTDTLVDTNTMKPMYSFATLLVGRPIYASGPYLDVLKVTNLVEWIHGRMHITYTENGYTGTLVPPKIYLQRLNVRTRTIDKEARLALDPSAYQDFWYLFERQDFSKVKVFWGKRYATVLNLYNNPVLHGKLIPINPVKLRKDEIVKRKPTSSNF